MKLFYTLLIILMSGLMPRMNAQTLTNAERAKLIAQDEEKKNKVKDLFKGREVYVGVDIYDNNGKKHRFYKICKNYFVDILSDGFYFSWEEERGDYSEDVEMLFTYSVNIPFSEINAVASYFTQMKNPIGTEKDYQKIASVVFQSKKGKLFEVFQQSFYIKNGKKQKKDSENVKKEFVLIPYAKMDGNCNTCTHENLTEKPRTIIYNYLKEKGY